MSDHGLLFRVSEDSTQCGDGPWVLHLAQAVGQLVLEQSRVIVEGLADPLDGISTWHRLQLQSAHTAQHKADTGALSEPSRHNIPGTDPHSLQGSVQAESWRPQLLGVQQRP